MPDSLRAMLRAGFKSRPVKVDREKNALRGYVVAQLGPFKSQGRGEFNEEGLALIERIGNEAKQGLKSRLNHATMCDDGLGNYLGRAKDFFLSSAVNADGVAVQAVRADLYFDETALQTPPKGGGKPIGVYVMDLAESDPDAISSSLVIKARKEYRRKPDGTLMVDEHGEELPPLWYAEKLYGSDIVDTGDAVDGLLSFDGLKDEHLRAGSEMLDGMFDGMSREEVAERLTSFRDRYLAMRFGEPEPIPAEKAADGTDELDGLALRVRRNRALSRMA